MKQITQHIVYEYIVKHKILYVNIIFIILDRTGLKLYIIKMLVLFSRIIYQN
jgi:hypothetical protein